MKRRNKPVSIEEGCAFCGKTTPVTLVRTANTSVTTVFRCTNSACSMYFHVACVRDAMNGNASAEFNCTECKTLVKLRTEPWFVTRAARALWCRYPNVTRRWAVSFALNRILDAFMLVCGLLCLVFFYSCFQQTDASGTWQPSDETVQYIVYTAMPAQLSQLRVQATNPENPSLAIATWAACWILGWMATSAWISALGSLFSCVRWQRPVQSAAGIIFD